MKPNEPKKMPIKGHLKRHLDPFYPAMLLTKTQRGETEVLIQSFIRKQLRLKAHTVTQVEEAEEAMIVYIERPGQRLLRWGYAGSGAVRSTA